MDKTNKFKKATIMVAGCIVGVTLLTRCSVVVDSANPDKVIPKGFELISVTTDPETYSLREVRHIETGCHYVYSHEAGITPMYINDEYGVPTIYCTK